MAIIKPVRGINPVFGENCFLADNAVVIGEVRMGKNCSVWFHAVVRGDVNSIDIGNNTNIQDGAVIHCTYKETKTIIGSNVSIAHNAIVHGCTIKDNVLIGMGAIIMDHSVVESKSVIAAGAIVLSGTIVPQGSVFAGVPARKVKDIGIEHERVFERTARNYIMYSGWYQ